MACRSIFATLLHYQMQVTPKSFLFPPRFAAPRTKADWLGIGASVACVAHCLAPTVAVAVSSAAWGHETEYLDYAFALFAVLAAWRAGKHAPMRVRLVLGVGAGAFVVGILLHSLHPNLVYAHLPASALLIAGHWVNLRSRPQRCVPSRRGIRYSGK